MKRGRTGDGPIEHIELRDKNIANSTNKKICNSITKHRTKKRTNTTCTFVTITKLRRIKIVKERLTKGELKEKEK
jgi:hypothetical protein